MVYVCKVDTIDHEVSAKCSVDNHAWSNVSLDSGDAVNVFVFVYPYDVARFLGASHETRYHVSENIGFIVIVRIELIPSLIGIFCEFVYDLYEFDVPANVCVAVWSLEISSCS